MFSNLCMITRGSLGNWEAGRGRGKHTWAITKSSRNNHERITTLSDFSPSPRTGHPQRARTALALVGVTSVVGLAGLGIVLALASNGDAVRGQVTPPAAPASFAVPAPATTPEGTWAPGVMAREAPGAQGAGVVPPDTVSQTPVDPEKQRDDPTKQPGDPVKPPDRRGSGHPGQSEFTPSRAPVPVLPPRMPGKKPDHKKPDQPTHAAPAVPGVRAPAGVAPAQTPPGAARSAVPRPGPEAPQPRPNPGEPRPGPEAPRPGPASVAPQPGPSRLPDPCATYHDARRDYCYSVVADLTAGH
jgi:hypothetical protein